MNKDIIEIFFFIRHFQCFWSSRVRLNYIFLLNTYQFGLALLKNISSFQAWTKLREESTMSEQLKRINFQEQLSGYMDAIEGHPVFRNSYFEFVVTNCFTEKTYEMHRANFFYRTEATVKGIAHICAHAAANDDIDTLILYAYILNEECGNGSKSRCHQLLMERSHNIFGKMEYGLADLKVEHAREIENKPNGLIVDGTKHYRAKISSLLSQSYETMLGVAYALETHASHMLSRFRDAFRLSRNSLPENDFVKNVEIYFNCHIDNGVEDRHASDAKTCVLNNCVSKKALSEIQYGIKETLDAQKAMWDSMYARVVNV